jgi:hypothetical protein
LVLELPSSRFCLGELASTFQYVQYRAIFLHSEFSGPMQRDSSTPLSVLLLQLRGPAYLAHRARLDKTEIQECRREMMRGSHRIIRRSQPKVRRRDKSFSLLPSTWFFFGAETGDFVGYSNRSLAYSRASVPLSTLPKRRSIRHWLTLAVQIPMRLLSNMGSFRLKISFHDPGKYVGTFQSVQLYLSYACRTSRIF